MPVIAVSCTNICYCVTVICKQILELPETSLNCFLSNCFSEKKSVILFAVIFSKLKIEFFIVAIPSYKISVFCTV